MARDIFGDMRQAAGCEFISDLRYLGDGIMDVLKKMQWEEYDGEDVKKLLRYLVGNKVNLDDYTLLKNNSG